MKRKKKDEQKFESECNIKLILVNGQQGCWEEYSQTRGKGEKE